MGIGVDKLTYDPTSADSLAASSTVGAYTLDGSGTRITSTAGSGIYTGKTGLDVSLISPISVTTDTDGVYDSMNNATPDSEGLIVNVRGATPDKTTQTKRMTGATAASDAVVAANVHGLDTNAFNMLYNGTTWDRWQGTGGSANVTVTNTAAVSDAALANTASKSTAVAPGTTATAFPAALASRKYLTFQNLNGNVFVGDSSVTFSTGLRLASGAMLEGLRIGPAITLKHVTQSGTGDLRIFELS